MENSILINRQAMSPNDSQSGKQVPSANTRLSIAESQEAIAQLKTFPETVRGLKKYTRTPKRTEVDRLLRDMERQFETANLFDDAVLDGLIETGEKVKTLLKEKPAPKQSPKPTTPHEGGTDIAPEVEALRLPLTADYEKQMKNLEWYGILETNEDGEKYYTADYDGSTEKDPNNENPDESKRRPCPDAHNFSGEKFTPPTLEKILASLAPQQAILYNEYLEKGLQPRLQLTPLALKLRTMAAKLDAKKEKINAKAGRELIKKNTYIWDAQESGEIDESTLLYEPETVTASADGQQLITKNGLTKSQLIQKYNGWLVEVVPMKQDLDADPDKKQKEITKDGKPTKVELTNAEKTVLYTEEAHGRGEHGQGYEDNLSAQMNALAEDKPAPQEKGHWTILPESSLTKNKKIVSRGSWYVDRVSLDGRSSRSQDSYLRFRRSVRVYVKP